jgi:glycosyltransferase involved in cell wall biosynthesis
MADIQQVAVSVIMSVYNGEQYLQAAVDSVLAQTFTDFEFIIINDGSTDKSAQILQQIKDPRVKLITQPNQGLVASLNTAIALAKAPLIARMDADDLSLPTRLERQVRFLTDNVDHVIVGSNLIFIDEAGNDLYESPMLLQDAEMKLELLVRNPFGHGSVTYRSAAVKQAGLYDPGAWPAEDTDLWRRLGKLGKFANINEYLYKYRMNEAGISRSNTTLQAEKLRNVMGRLWAADQLPAIPSFAEVKMHYRRSSPASKLQLGRLMDLYWLIIVAALRRGQLRFALSAVVRAHSSGAGIIASAKFMGRRFLGK